MSEAIKTSDEKLPFFLKKNRGLSTFKPGDDLLHPASFAEVKDDSATETQYFGFSVPEAGIHALTYMWWHPNLKVCSGGLFVFQGIKHHTIEAEICDWRTFMNDSALKNDLHEFRFDNGYGVKVIEPQQRFHLTYADPANENSVDLMIEAVLPAVLTADGKHFDQPMKVKGELLLRGKRYAIDCYNVRDRSWGKPRPETLMPVPPMSWMTGVFRDDFAFNCTVLDHASGQPERNGKFVVPDDQALNNGWVYRDDKLGSVVSVHKRVVRSPGSATCFAIELRFTDEHDRQFEMRGSLVASCPISGWNNALTVINLMRWDCDGLVTYGDNQEVFWGPFANSTEYKGRQT
jgi:hypothetical protein